MRSFEHSFKPEVKRGVAHVVILSGLAVMNLLGSTSVTPLCLAADTAATDADSAAQSTSETSSAQELPDIEAKTYPTKVIRHTQAGTMYLLEITTDELPYVGKILLLKKDDESVAAFRVLKLYDDKNQVAAKKVKTYPNQVAPEAGEDFTAVEKVSDLVTPPQSIEDTADLKELEAAPSAAAPASASDQPAAAPSPNVVPAEESDEPPQPKPVTKPYDAELDAGTSPDPASDPSAGKDEDGSSLAVAVDEIKPIDPHKNWLTAGGGFVTTPLNSGALGFYQASAFVVRYGLTLNNTMLLKGPTAQDSLAIEGSLFFDTINNYASSTSTESYSLMPIVLALRYTISFTQNLGVFFYGGVLQGTVLSAVNESPTTNINNLKATLPAAGGGLIFGIGPNWDARLDIGFDAIAAGLMLRF